jgi:hypothetical protein
MHFYCKKNLFYQKKIMKTKKICLKSLVVSTVLSGFFFSATAQNLPSGVRDFAYLPQLSSPNYNAFTNYANGSGTSVQDSFGNIYVRLDFSGVIYKVTPSGQSTAFVGKHGVCGYADGLGQNARFTFSTAVPPAITKTLTSDPNSPTSYLASGYNTNGMVIDKNNNIYVADGTNIRKINTLTRYVERFAGQFPPDNLKFDPNPGQDCIYNSSIYRIMLKNGSYVMPKMAYILTDLYPDTPDDHPEMFDAAPQTTEGDALNTHFDVITGLALDEKQEYLYVLDKHSEKPLRRIRISDQQVETLIEIPKANMIAYPLAGVPVSRPSVVQPPSSYLWFGLRRGLDFSKDYRHLYFADVSLCRIVDFNLDGYLKETVETDKYKRAQKYLSTLIGGELTSPNNCQASYARNLAPSDGIGSAATLRYLIDLKVNRRTGNILFLEHRVGDTKNTRIRQVSPYTKVTSTLYNFQTHWENLLLNRNIDMNESVGLTALSFYTDQSDPTAPVVRGLVPSSVNSTFDPLWVAPILSFDLGSGSSVGRRKLY